MGLSLGQGCPAVGCGLIGGCEMTGVSGDQHCENRMDRERISEEQVIRWECKWHHIGKAGVLS